MYLREIFEGSEDFKGLNNLLLDYLQAEKSRIQEESLRFSSDVTKQAISSFQFLTDISNGKIPTNSSILREFVQSHPDYKQDSVISTVSI